MAIQFIRFPDQRYQTFHYTSGNVQQIANVAANTVTTTSTLTFQIPYFLSEDRVRWLGGNVAVVNININSTNTDVDIQNLFLTELKGIQNGYIMG
jgi:hypothetical protein